MTEHPTLRESLARGNLETLMEFRYSTRYIGNCPSPSSLTESVLLAWKVCKNPLIDIIHIIIAGRENGVFCKKPIRKIRHILEARVDAVDKSLYSPVSETQVEC
jgi:hypothetical protein